MRVQSFLQKLSNSQAVNAARSGIQASRKAILGGTEPVDDSAMQASMEEERRHDELDQIIRRLNDSPQAKWANRFRMNRSGEAKGLVDVMREQQQVKLTKDQFATIYRASVGREISHDELEFTFRLLDGDND